MHQTTISKPSSLDRALYSGLGILLFAVFSIPVGMQAFADYSTTTTAAVRVASVCYMGATITSAHTATLLNGTYSANTEEYSGGIGKTAIRTNCNDATGYAIYAIGYTGNSYTGSNHTKLVGAGTNNVINTGVYNPSSTTDSLWSMKVNNVSGGTTIENGYNNYSAVPAIFIKVASYGSATSSDSGNIIETTYAAYIGLDQVADTYTGQVKYVLVHPNNYIAGTYSIAYNANGGSGTMTGDTGIYNFEPYALKASTFTPPTGGTFLGWCTTNTSQFSCNDGTSYAAGEAVASLGSAGDMVNLYAYWRIDQPMQNFSCQNSGLSVGGTKYLYDTRDNNVYLVGKLADGKCWMLDNLALDPTTANLTASNTNATEAAITNFKTGGNPGGNAGWTTQAVVNKTSGWNNDSPNNAYEYPYVNVNFKNNTTTKFGTAGSGKIGVYYNYCAATVGTYCYASGAGKDIPGTITDAPIDICPANWRMPTGGSSGEYQSLCTTLKGSACSNEMDMAGTDTNSLQYNLDLPLSGLFWNSSQNYVAGNGYWWSSTRYSGNYMYSLLVHPSQVWSMDINHRYYGFHLRCLANS